MALAIASTIAAPDQSSAQTYPVRPIKIVSPFSAGSAPDQIGRLVAQSMSERLGQNVVIENRPGAGTLLATKAVAAAEPDGYTLLQGNSALAYAATLSPDEKLDPQKAFTPVALVASWSLVLVVTPDVPARDVADFISYAKTRGGEMNIGFVQASPPQVLAEALKTETGLALGSIPYRQLSQLTADLLGGRVQVNFGSANQVAQLVRDRKLKALAYTGTRRSTLLPEIPTMAESGWSQLTFDPADWTGFLAPAGTPPAIVDSLYKAISDVLRSPDARAALAKQGVEIRTENPGAFASFLQTEVARWPALVKKAGLKVE
jgi:tripartite-type tricarboxylate transporter receptor subunit TctC